MEAKNFLLTWTDTDQHGVTIAEYGLYVDEMPGKDKIWMLFPKFEKIQPPKNYRRKDGFFVSDYSRFIKVWIKE